MIEKFEAILNKYLYYYISWIVVRIIYEMLVYIILQHVKLINYIVNKFFLFNFLLFVIRIYFLFFFILLIK